MLGTKGESSAACQMLKCERKRAERSGWERGLERTGRSKAEPNQSPSHTPGPHPQPAEPRAIQPGRAVWGGRNGRGPGKATKTISSRNVHLQLEGAQGQAPPQQASGRAAGACSEPHGHSVCRGSLGPTHLSIPSSPHSPRTFKSDQVSHQRGGAEPWDSNSSSCYLLGNLLSPSFGCSSLTCSPAAISPQVRHGGT